MDEANESPIVVVELKPRKVPMGVARKLLGEKGRSQVYDLLSEGKLTGSKDGFKVLIDVSSIENYLDSLPPLVIAPKRRQKFSSEDTARLRRKDAELRKDAERLRRKDAERPRRRLRRVHKK
jgi:hypothetical protein